MYNNNILTHYVDVIKITYSMHYNLDVYCELKVDTGDVGAARTGPDFLIHGACTARRGPQRQNNRVTPVRIIYITTLLISNH